MFAVVKKSKENGREHLFSTYNLEDAKKLALSYAQLDIALEFNDVKIQNKYDGQKECVFAEYCFVYGENYKNKKNENVFQVTAEPPCVGVLVIRSIELNIPDQLLHLL